MNDHRILVVWAHARKLAVAVYKQTAGFPAIERLGLAEQMRLSVLAAVTTLAEAHNRRASRKRIALLVDARGAMYRLQTQALISGDLAFLPPQHAAAIVKAAVVIGRQITTLLRAATSASTNPSSRSRESSR